MGGLLRVLFLGVGGFAKCCLRLCARGLAEVEDFEADCEKKKKKKQRMVHDWKLISWSIAWKMLSGRFCRDESLKGTNSTDEVSTCGREPFLPWSLLRNPDKVRFSTLSMCLHFRLLNRPPTPPGVEPICRVLSLSREFSSIGRSALISPPRRRSSTLAATPITRNGRSREEGVCVCISRSRDSPRSAGRSRLGARPALQSAMARRPSATIFAAGPRFQIRAMYVESGSYLNVSLACDGRLEDISLDGVPTVVWSALFPQRPVLEITLSGKSTFANKI